MTMPRLLPAVLGVAALLATAVVFLLDVANARTARKSSTVQTAAAVASGFEAIMFVLLAVLLSTCLRKASRPKRSAGIWFAVSLVGSVVATTASVVVLVILGQDTENELILGGPELNFLIGAAVGLGFAFAGQLLFVVVYFVVSRLSGSDQIQSSRNEEEGRFTPQMRVKSIPYTRTTVTSAKSKEWQVTDHQSPPSTSSGHSVAGTFSSIRTSISHAVRPISSKTRLLSMSSRTGSIYQQRRTASLESTSNQERSSVVEDGFDSWDTSGVDSQSRQTVLETSSPPAPRFLETIPASPTTSRSPSPGCALDLEPPKKTRRRSRSYSPVPKPPPLLTAHASTSELHIHPLFRSDSPTPPPAATPGTSVVAAPQAGRTISEKSLTRMRSGSLPSSPSPLNRSGSYDSGRMTPTLAEAIEEEERRMTPPIPGWVLGAGSRTSFTEYQCRKLRDGEIDMTAGGLGISQ
ncbi:uncharacterized protein BCR38DRAFT_481236 [Pseudomassariella vexata]|uniref:Uncharacterized protein n=1 Tax=Pseudomassariella vexata TaxID=1141098 RepID=A0A1Y2EFP9_9PEZI|nr:uncharacterized protein BCR38DRAFT_481236 [Pseudomassariella vexata]ORY70086.1 hypothetical protein BCR38DRAFT_481236 [Pseudomassariella vexata]